MHHRPLLAAALALPLWAVSVLAAGQFQDIPAGHWAKRPASVLAEANIMPGRTPVDFAGDTALTRYELAWILSHLYKEEGPPATFVVLRDMPAGHYATEEVQRAIGFGLLSARKPGQFEGDVPVQRKEVVEALDLVFQKNGITPPARKTAVLFSDVRPGTPLGQSLDRIVNRFGLLDAKSYGPFHPFDAVSRFQMLAMLMRAMRYVNPRLADELTKPIPTPQPSLAPGESPGPTPSLAPGESPPPASVGTRPPGFLHSQAWAAGDVLLLYAEGLPTDPGLIAAGEQRQFSGNILPGGDVGLAYWNGPLGGTLEVSSVYVGLNVPSNAKLVPIDLLDTFATIGGYYTIAWDRDWELALGGVASMRYTYNITGGPLLSQSYLTADKTYLGLGPAATLGMRMSPNTVFTGGLALVPELQTYNLPSGPKSVARFGAVPYGRLEVDLGGGLQFVTGADLRVSGGGGGNQTMLGAQAGLGARF